MARTTATAAMTVNCVAADGCRRGRNSTENQSPRPDGDSQREEKNRRCEDVRVLPEGLPRARLRAELSLHRTEVPHPAVDHPGEHADHEADAKRPALQHPHGGAFGPSTSNSASARREASTSACAVRLAPLSGRMSAFRDSFGESDWPLS